jgi:uncharacterized protein (TIGR02145 family)
MKLNLIFLICAFISVNISYSQTGVSVSTAGAPADNSAMLDISSTLQGFLIPRMTTSQRDDIVSPATSLLIYNTTTDCFESYVNGIWFSVSCPSCIAPSAPTVGTNTASKTQIIWNWNTVNEVIGYKWNSVNNYTSAVDNSTSISYTQTGILCGTNDTLYVWAYNTCKNSAVAILTQATSSCEPTADCGTMVWAAANVNAGTQISGSSEQNNDAVIEKFCYNDIATNCDIYGGLYEWAETVQLPYTYNTNSYGTLSWMTCNPCGNNGIQGICPSGYHIPTDLEWSQYEYCVENYIIPTGSTPLSDFQTISGSRGSTTPGIGPGDKMKAASPDWNGTNTSGFNALPAGYRNSWGIWYFQGIQIIYWAATENSATLVWVHALDSYNVQSSRGLQTKKSAWSVRCVKN